MSVEELQTRVKKLSMRSTQAKMALHDLAEELPTDWRKILIVAQETYDIFLELDTLRRELKAAKAAQAGV